MSSPVLRVESLSKRYMIHHKARARYTTLRDEIAGRTRALGRRLTGRRYGASGEASSATEELWALRDVSFEVHQGERIGVIGGNGAGKSTLLKLLSRITEPTCGRIGIRGRVSSLLEVGTGFHPELTGRENIYLNGAVLGMRRHEIEHKFDEIVEFAEVTRFLDTPVKRYSSGMYVRLAFAVAAHLEPEILLVDEVLAVGDVSFQKKCLGKMEEVAEGGRTVLFVSHNMASICNLCARVIYLDAGGLIADGESGLVVQRYMAEGGSAKGVARWPDSEQAPSDGSLRLVSAAVHQGRNCEPVGQVDVSMETVIEVSFRNLLEGNRAYCGIVLHDKLGTPVLQSLNSDPLSSVSDPFYAKPLPVGIYSAKCHIPPNLLNEGRYSVTILMGRAEPFIQTLYEENAIAFDALITDDPHKSYYAGCLVRPKLAWETEAAMVVREANSGIRQEY